MMLRLCLLLINVRNFARATNVEVQPHHHAWMEPEFDYPMEKKLIPELTETYSVQQKLESGAELLKLQEEFLVVDLSDDDEGMGEASNNNVREVLVAVEIPKRK